MKFCVIGIGRFGSAVAKTLADRGIEVLAVDKDAKAIEGIKDFVSQAICMEIVDEDTMRELGIDDMDAVIVGIGENFAQSILLTALLKQNLRFPRVIVRAVSTIHRDILYLIGADQIVMAEHEMGIRLADNLSMHFDSRAIITPQFAVAAIIANERFQGKPISWIYNQYEATCIGKQHNGSAMSLPPDYIIEIDDELLVAGAVSQLERLWQLTQ